MSGWLCSLPLLICFNSPHPAWDLPHLKIYLGILDLSPPELPPPRVNKAKSFHLFPQFAHKEFAFEDSTHP